MLSCLVTDRWAKRIPRIGFFCAEWIRLHYHIFLLLSRDSNKILDIFCRVDFKTCKKVMGFSFFINRQGFAHREFVSCKMPSFLGIFWSETSCQLLCLFRSVLSNFLWLLATAEWMESAIVSGTVFYLSGISAATVQALCLYCLQWCHFSPPLSIFSFQGTRLRLSLPPVSRQGHVLLSLQFRLEMKSRHNHIQVDSLHFGIDHVGLKYQFLMDGITHNGQSPPSD